MNESHKAYLNLGSNIQPEINIGRAIELLRSYGEIRKVSRAWESESVGAPGPNYLNVCVSFVSSHTKIELKEHVIYVIETQLGRIRTEDKYIPRTIDIDIILFDDKPQANDIWETGFVVVPLAEIYPEYENPITSEKITDAATRLRSNIWMKPHPGIPG